MVEEINWRVRDMLWDIEKGSIDGITIDGIAKELGKSDRTIQNKIKELGYKWDAKHRKYDYIGAEPEPKDIDFRSLFPQKESRKKAVVTDEQREKLKVSKVNSSVNSSETIDKDDNLNGGVKGETKYNHNTVTSNTKDIQNINNDEYAIIDSLLGSKSKAKKEYRGFYLDANVLAIVDSVADKRKKSELVNEALKIVFRNRGLL